MNETRVRIARTLLAVLFAPICLAALAPLPAAAVEVDEATVVGEPRDEPHSREPSAAVAPAAPSGEVDYRDPATAYHARERGVRNDRRDGASSRPLPWRALLLLLAIIGLGAAASD